MLCGMTCDSAPNGVSLDMPDINDALLESPLLEFHRAAGCELAPYFGVTLPAHSRTRSANIVPLAKQWR